jgi:hypothetical protein
LKILITAGTTATALKLRSAFEGEVIIFGDYGEVPNISSSLYTLVSMGSWNAEVLAHNLLTKCLDYGVDAVLPLYELEIEAISKSLVLFEEFGLKVFLPEPGQLSGLTRSATGNHWMIFDNGVLLHTSFANEKMTNEAELQHLTGAYFYEADSGKFSLLSVPNPSAR